MWCKILGVLRWRQVMNYFFYFYELQKRFFLKSSVPLSLAVQQLLPQQASVGAGNQRAGKYMAGNIIASRPLKPTSMINSEVQWVSTRFTFNESSLWIEAKVFRKFPVILKRAASCFSDGISSHSRLIVISWGNVNCEVIKSALCLCLRCELLWEFGHHFGEMKKNQKTKNPKTK